MPGEAESEYFVSEDWKYWKDKDPEKYKPNIPMPNSMINKNERDAEE